MPERELPGGHGGREGAGLGGWCGGEQQRQELDPAGPRGAARGRGGLWGPEHALGHPGAGSDPGRRHRPALLPGWGHWDGPGCSWFPTALGPAAP